jgi:glutaminase
MKMTTLGHAPIGHVVTSTLQGIRNRVVADDRSGSVADYIPELSLANPDWCAVALVSVEGHPYVAGDAAQPLTLQSISKPFVYALALADLGLERVASRVGSEPSGEAFNAISLEPGTGRPANPMINAGAMMATSLVRASNAAERFERIRQCLSAFAGHSLSVDEAVFASEMETGDRNRALAYLMRSAGALQGSVNECVEVYFRQCAVSVTTRDLAVMAATLANGGVNPVTGIDVVGDRIAGHVLSVMATCGMYDFSGEWLLQVGLPAKSGVSGGIIAVSPGQFGIGVFGPRLDRHGNSVRGTNMLRELSSRFDLHLMHRSPQSGPVVYRATTAAASPSHRTRPGEERDALQTDAGRIAILAAQGEIEFAAAERLLWTIEHSLEARPEGRALRPQPEAQWLVLDLRRVTRLHPAATHMLDAHLTHLLAHDVFIAIVQPDERLLLPAAGEFDNCDDAVAWCEDALLVARR